VTGYAEVVRRQTLDRIGASVFFDQRNVKSSSGRLPSMSPKPVSGPCYALKGSRISSALPTTRGVIAWEIGPAQ
jgi:hypothetical protein